MNCSLKISSGAIESSRCISVEMRDVFARDAKTQNLDFKIENDGSWMKMWDESTYSTSKIFYTPINHCQCPYIPWAQIIKSESSLRPKTITNWQKHSQQGSHLMPHTLVCWKYIAVTSTLSPCGLGNLANPSLWLFFHPYHKYRVFFLTGSAPKVLSVGDGKIPTKKMKVRVSHRENMKF